MNTVWEGIGSLFFLLSTSPLFTVPPIPLPSPAPVRVCGPLVPQLFLWLKRRKARGRKRIEARVASFKRKARAWQMRVSSTVNKERGLSIAHLELGGGDGGDAAGGGSDHLAASTPDSGTVTRRPASSESGLVGGGGGTDVHRAGSGSHCVWGGVGGGEGRVRRELSRRCEESEALSQVREIGDAKKLRYLRFDCESVMIFVHFTGMREIFYILCLLVFCGPLVSQKSQSSPFLPTFFDQLL